MITRGLIIGKIVDDIAGLKYQIQARNKLQLYDLTKVCEDFFKEVLNIVYGYDLKNLNQERINEPGIDLGDRKKKIAYQITSTKYSPKIKATLKSITKKQISEYNVFMVFIIGDKASSYTIEKKLLDKCSFRIDQNIVDLDNLLKDIIVSEMAVLDSLFTLFQREFRQIKIEFEPLDSEGNFESSLYNQLEQIPNKKPENAKRMAERFDEDGFDDSSVSFGTVLELYSKLSKIPRITRELIPIIVERGTKKTFNHRYEEYGILPQILKNILRFTDDELSSEMAILSDSDVIYLGENYIDEVLHFYITLSGFTINELIDWSIENEISLRKMFNILDWTILDE